VVFRGINCWHCYGLEYCTCIACEGECAVCQKVIVIPPAKPRPEWKESYPQWQKRWAEAAKKREAREKRAKKHEPEITSDGDPVDPSLSLWADSESDRIEID